jgi:hypothetical protein
MTSIKEKAEKHLNSVYAGYDDVLKELVKESYVSGANYVLDAIEEFMVNLNLGNNSAEKFYKFDLIADIHAFIEQLKK